MSLDPNLETTAPGAWVYFNMLEGLLTLDDKMQVKPALATGYEVMSPTKVRFKLRPGVKFHDGTPFNAAAVKFTFDRALHGNPPARWASLAGSLAGAEVVDDLTVDIMTKEPYGPILRTLAMYCMGIVSPTAVQKMGDGFSRAPVGTGPFKFVEWKTNTHVILERNPDYWGEKALLDRVVFKVVPEEGARMIALQTGDADMVLIPAPAQLPALKRDPKFTVHEVVGGRVVFAGMNASMPPLDDVRVRTALCTPSTARPSSRTSSRARRPRRAACSRRACSASRTWTSTSSIPTTGPRPKALLAQAGWTPGPDGVLTKGGQRLSLSWVAARGRYPKDGEITEAIQAMLKDVGVEAKVQFLEWATVFPQLRAATLNHNLFTLGWVTSNADADYSLYALFHSKDAPPTGWNTSRYVNPKVRARRAGAPEPQPDRAREALWRGAGHPGQGDGVDSRLHDEGDRRHARLGEGLQRASGRVQPLAREDLARQVAPPPTPDAVVLTFVTRRLLLAVPVLLGVVFVVMLTVQLIPGDAVQLMLGEHATPEAVASCGTTSGSTSRSSFDTWSTWGASSRVTWAGRSSKIGRWSTSWPTRGRRRSS